MFRGSGETFAPATWGSSQACRPGPGNCGAGASVSNNPGASWLDVRLVPSGLSVRLPSGLASSQEFSLGLNIGALFLCFTDEESPSKETDEDNGGLQKTRNIITTNLGVAGSTPAGRTISAGFGVNCTQIGWCE
jgi:hypothetical protein